MMPANGMTQAQIMAETMTMLQGMMGQLAGVFLVGHLFFGAGLGVLVGYGVSRKSRTSSAATLVQEGRQSRCTTCGAAFNTQAELMEHVKQAHPTPAH